MYTHIYIYIYIYVRHAAPAPGRQGDRAAERGRPAGKHGSLTERAYALSSYTLTCAAPTLDNTEQTRRCEYAQSAY